MTQYAYACSRYHAATPPERELNCKFNKAIAKYALKLGYFAYCPLQDAKWWETETLEKRTEELEKCFEVIRGMGDRVTFFVPKWQERSAGMVAELRLNIEAPIVYVTYDQIKEYME